MSDDTQVRAVIVLDAISLQPVQPLHEDHVSRGDQHLADIKLDLFIHLLVVDRARLAHLHAALAASGLEVDACLEVDHRHQRVAVEQQASDAGTAGVLDPNYKPAGVTGQYATYKGIPIVPVEYMAALGTTGDIMLTSLDEYTAIDKGAIDARFIVGAEGADFFLAYVRTNAAPDAPPPARRAARPTPRRPRAQRNGNNDARRTLRSPMTADC